MTKLAATFLLVPLVFILIGCPARPRPLNQPQAIFADGAYTHEKSGMTFPLAVGDFQRNMIQRYDQEGLDVSVGYNLQGGKQVIIATVYVYPAPPLIFIGSPSETVASAQVLLAKKEFDARKREILQPRPGARLIEDTEVSIPIGGALRVGRMASFEHREQFFGQPQTLRSHLFMFNFVGGKWALKYRITYPSHLEVTREIDAFLQGVPWNVLRE